jgi:hypothetical protein
MNLTSKYKYLAPVFMLLILLSGCKQESDVGKATQDLSIGRMRVSIWPEHDDPSLLAIYDGRFEESASYPIKTSFLLPKGSVVSDACSLSYEGQHFCQLYKTVNRGEYDEVSLTLPYPNFYLSFHTPQFDVQHEKRSLDYRIRTNHPVKAMEIDVEQPLRSTEFTIAPPEHAVQSQQGDAISVVKGFKHFAYTMQDVGASQENLFRLTYIKKDPKPSLDIKYVSMKGPKSFGGVYETQKNIKSYIYIIFTSGMIAVLALVIWFFRSRRKRRGESQS